MNNELLTSIENPTLAHFRHFSSLFTNLPSTTVESALQNHLFMQNKANFRKSQMNVNNLLTMDYVKWTLGERGKNKPNTNPIQTQTNPITEKPKMNVSTNITKGYDNKSHFWAIAKQTQFKPNTNPIPISNQVTSRQKSHQKWLFWCKAYSRYYIERQKKNLLLVARDTQLLIVFMLFVITIYQLPIIN